MGLILAMMAFVFSFRDRSLRSSSCLWCIVSGTRKNSPRTPVPARAVWSQKIDRQEEYVTMTPPKIGPNAGPINVPERNQPMAVPRSVGRYMSLNRLVYRVLSQAAARLLLAYPIDAAPRRINAVPSNAEHARKTKKAARLGDNAVARLSRKNSTAVRRRICKPRVSQQPPPLDVE